MGKYSQTFFIEQSKKIHGDKYDYSMVKYKNNRSKVLIVCPLHGVFEQSGYHHINKKRGCHICGSKKSHNKQIKTLEKFISDSEFIHNNRYDYSLVNYINNKSKVKIICKEHGIFEQRPDAHITQGQGCPKCSYVNISDNIKHTTEVFIDRAKKIHGDNYDYSMVEYKNMHTKVKISCRKHGVFEQKPNNHINQKQGCPICKLSKGEIKVKNFLDSCGVEYIQQHIFPDCKNIKPLPFDFYLPKYNTCIEYDGRLHSHPWERSSSSLDEFKKRIFLDGVKNKFCEDNNIELIRISYEDYDRIDDIIKNLLIKL